MSLFFEFELIMYTKKSEEEDIGRIFFETLETEIRKVCDMIKHKRGMKKEMAKESLIKPPIVIFVGKVSVRQIVRSKTIVRHISGKFRGAAHNKCNMRFRVPTFTPVFFHNLSGYDSHLFVNNLGVTEGDIRCIPSNEEKYISFSKNIKVEKITEKIIRVRRLSLITRSVSWTVLSLWLAPLGH